MNFADAELEENTGFPVIPGQVSFGNDAEMEALGIPPHDRVLMVYRPARNCSGPSMPSVTFWPVLHTERHTTGFCEVAVADIGVEIGPLSPHELTQIEIGPEKDVNALRFTRCGENHVRLTKARLTNATGEEVARPGPKGRMHLTPQPSPKNQMFEASSHFSGNGLNVAIRCCFAAVDTVSGTKIFPHELSGKEIAIDVIIPWEILALKDIQRGRAHLHGHGPGSLSATDTPKRSRGSRKLSDLLFESGLNWLYVNGHVALDANEGNDFVNIDFAPDQIGVSSVAKLIVLDNGFAHGSSDWLGLAPQLMIKAFGRRLIEEALIEKPQKKAFSLTIAGDGIGQIQFRTNDGDEPFDRLNKIAQNIRTLSFTAQMDKMGLVLSASGELSDFDKEEREAHVKARERYRAPPLIPFTTYSATATIPWAFLVVRESLLVPWVTQAGFL